MVEDLLKALFFMFLWFIIWFTSFQSSYYNMRSNYINCQIKYSNKIEFQSWFAERLFEK